MALLTDKVVEERVIARVSLKAATFGQDIGEQVPSGQKDQNGKTRMTAKYLFNLLLHFIMEPYNVNHTCSALQEMYNHSRISAQDLP